jgi:hypothetical protein
VCFRSNQFSVANQPNVLGDTEGGRNPPPIALHPLEHGRVKYPWLHLKREVEIATVCSEIIEIWMKHIALTPPQWQGLASAGTEQQRPFAFQTTNGALA